MSNKNEWGFCLNHNKKVSQFTLESNQAVQVSALLNAQSNKPYDITPSSGRQVRSLNGHVQNLLRAVRGLIDRNSIDEAISSMVCFLQYKFKDAQKGKMALSPSKIISHLNLISQDQSILDLYYCLGTCFMSRKQYSTALQIFNQLQTRKYKQKNSLMVVISICNQRLVQFQQALNALQRVEDDPKTRDQLFLKARILNKLQRFGQSQLILKQILAKQCCHFESIKLLLQVYKDTKSYSKGLSLIDLSILDCWDQGALKYLRVKKVQFQYLNQQFQLSLQSIEFLQGNYRLSQSKLNYFKGKICLKLKNFQDSVIYFNQALEVNSNAHFVQLALSQLITYFLSQRDFYQASSYCKRSAFILSVKSPIIQALSYLSEGLILLMKRNFQQGLKTLSRVEIQTLYCKAQEENTDFLQNLLRNALGFSFFSLGKHQQAFQEYSKIKLIQGDEQYYPCLYNMKLCEGIISIIEQSNEEKAIECFQKAIDYMLRPEPYFYISVLLTQKNIKQEASAEVFVKILSILERGISAGQTTEMYFYRALIFIFLGMNLQALEDLDKAIQISQDNFVQHFYAKGILYFLQGNYEQAICQFQVALSIDQNNLKVMIQKAKCQVLQGNSEEAYRDLELYRQLGKSEKDQKVWELYFLFHQRKFEQIMQLDLASLYQNAATQTMEQIREIRTTCSFFLGRFQESGPSGKLVLALIYQTFEQLLKLLDEALMLKVNVGPISQIDLKFMKAYILFKLYKYEQAICIYEQIEIMLSMKQKQVCRQQIQLNLLIVKINVIFCYHSQKQLFLCRQRLEALINQINEGQVHYQLKQILNVISTDGYEAPPGNKQPYIVSLFYDKQMLSSFLPMQTINNLSFKVMIPFPGLNVPQLKPNHQVMLELYDLNSIQNKPQAPWIKRGQFGVLFTNQIREYNNLKLNTEESQTNSKSNLTNSGQNLNENIKSEQLGSEILLKLKKIKQIC